MLHNTRRSQIALLSAEIETSLEKRLAPAFQSADAPSWLEAISDLLHCGRLDAAEHGVRHFCQWCSTSRFADRISAVFDRLPPADTQLPFEDDPAKDVQVVARPGAETVVLLFCGGIHELGLPVAMEHRWHGRLNASLVYLRDFQHFAFLRGVSSLGADRDATIAALRRIVASIGGRRIVCYGTSGGVFGSLSYGLDLGAEAILCMSGATNLSPKFNAYSTWKTQARKLSDEMPGVALDMRPLYASASRPPRLRIVYGQDFWDDRIHAEHMSALSCVTLQAIENFDEHNSIVELILRGQFDDVLHWLVPPVPPANMLMNASAPGWLTRLRRFVTSHAKSVRIV